MIESRRPLFYFDSVPLSWKGLAAQEDWDIMYLIFTYKTFGQYNLIGSKFSHIAETA